MTSPPASSLSGRIAALEAALPQTQCTRCGFPHCRAYAEALAHGATAANRCPPGGPVTLERLAALLQLPPQTLDPALGPRGERLRAEVIESACIGCAKCLAACPTDALVGSRKWMHAVVASDCSGCALCVPLCPVDCITLRPVAAAAPGPWPDYGQAEADCFRRLAYARRQRLATTPRPDTGAATPERARIRAEIAAAVARVRARKPG